MSISHNVDNSGWTTELSTQMRLMDNRMKRDGHLYIDLGDRPQLSQKAIKMSVGNLTGGVDGETRLKKVKKDAGKIPSWIPGIGGYQFETTHAERDIGMDNLTWISRGVHGAEKVFDGMAFIVPKVLNDFKWPNANMFPGLKPHDNSYSIGDTTPFNKVYFFQWDPNRDATSWTYVHRRHVRYMTKGGRRTRARNLFYLPIKIGDEFCGQCGGDVGWPLGRVDSAKQGCDFSPGSKLGDPSKGIRGWTAERNKGATMISDGNYDYSIYMDITFHIRLEPGEYYYMFVKKDSEYFIIGKDYTEQDMDWIGFFHNNYIINRKAIAISSCD
jgi:hypothetical protein